MGHNIYIAYLLWFFLSAFSEHRIYCGKSGAISKDIILKDI
ncbi:NINE protein [Campylobacter lanienae]|nr:NINE protein [Campylobacter lanienae]MDD7514742.1 NINE protein [Campylobacter lanienae]MDY5519324.1 NINE protein [Campylobacter lanienae]